MFFRMLKGVFTRQIGNMLLLLFAAALSVSVLSSMLNLLLGVGDKVNKELKAYGANIILLPKSAAMLSERYSGDTSEFIEEKELLKVKTIFWAHNIVDFAPFLTAKTEVDGTEFEIIGTWFEKDLLLPTGDAVTTGIRGLKSWWNVDGKWIEDGDMEAVMAGSVLLKRLDVPLGGSLYIAGKRYIVKGVITSGGAEDEQIFMPLKEVQDITNKNGVVNYAEVSALTTPENDLARKASQDIRSLTAAEYDTWYCTAYISSIIHQLHEELPGVRAKAVLQVSESEGVILKKTGHLMLMLTVLCMAASILCISNLITAKVLNRTAEIGLLKALGANDYEVVLLILTEVMLVALIGGVVGYFCGVLLTQMLGSAVFGANIPPSPLTVPVVITAVLFMTTAGSIPAIKALLKLSPKEALNRS